MVQRAGYRWRRCGCSLARRNHPLSERTRSSVQPSRHPVSSSSLWSLAAVYRPLHAIHKAPTIRPRLHELEVRHTICMSKWTRCWLTKPETFSAGEQSALAMPSSLSLCRYKVAAPASFSSWILFSALPGTEQRPNDAQQLLETQRQSAWHHQRKKGSPQH